MTGSARVLARWLLAAAVQGLAAPLGAQGASLQVPLAASATERERFVEAFRRADRYHARALYESYIDRIGANGIIAGIRAVAPRCHDEGHDLGKVIYARLRDVNAALRVCDDACNSGCMHGVVTELFSAGAARAGAAGDGGEGAPAHHAAPSPAATAALMRRTIPTLCGSSAFESAYRAGDCAHGVGHAAMFLAGYRVDEAIAHCDLFDTHAMRFYCASGAYMEYRLERSDADHATKGPFYPCDRSPYPAACFRYKLVSTFAKHYQQRRPLAEIARGCAALAGKYRLGCFHGVGNAHVGLVAGGALTLADVCRLGGPDDRRACIEGAMERLGKFHGEVAAARCNALAGRERAVCLASAARKMYDAERDWRLYPR